MPLTNRDHKNGKKDVNPHQVIIKRQVKRYSLSPVNVTSTFKEFSSVEINKVTKPKEGQDKRNVKTQLNDYTTNNPKPEMKESPPKKDIENSTSLPFTPSMC